MINQMDADIVFIQELMSTFPGTVMRSLLMALNDQPAPRNNWRYAVIKGALSTNATPPYDTFDDTTWNAGRHEGYAVLWNQNIAKFTMQRAAKVEDGNGILHTNTQSMNVCEDVTLHIPNPVRAVLPFFGDRVVPANIAQPYTIPAGTVRPGHGNPC